MYIIFIEEINVRLILAVCLTELICNMSNQLCCMLDSAPAVLLAVLSYTHFRAVIK